MTPWRTSRTERLLASPLSPDEAKLVRDVEAYGCHIIQVQPDDIVPGWSYTIGLHETINKPELIVVGLPDDVAHCLLNEAAARLRNGAPIEDGRREKDLLADVECEFRDLEVRWLRPLMGYAIWFYEKEGFPAMQCIYPDLSNRFPWEAGFDQSWRSRQALLFANAAASGIEEDLWAANDPNSSLFDWKFADPPHTGVYTTKQIMNREEPILYVTHDADDGAWQFHGPSESNLPALICFHHIVDHDPTIMELVDLPRGYLAWRKSITAPWTREAKPVSEEQ